jgi:transaldolase
MNTAQQLHEAGQSIWYDNIQRGLLENGELAGMIERGEIRGVTSNPTIFMNAITKSSDYDAGLVPLALAGRGAEEIFWELAIEDIQAAADLFRPLYDASNAGDGYVSLEVSPFLADDAERTLAAAKWIWKRVGRPNLMVKIPATKAGLPAITGAIAAGINVNVTLIFSNKRYAEVMDAYLKGLEEREAAGLPVDRVASVASFFVSRVDTKVDARLQAMMGEARARMQKAQELAGKATLANPAQAHDAYNQAVGGDRAVLQKAETLGGKAAIANARLAYAAFKEVFGSDRFQALKAQGARVQRPLWASTGTKNPAYRDVVYVEELVGPNTVNTVPPATLAAFLEHGVVRAGSLEENLGEANRVLEDLEALGISMAAITDELEEEGVKAFADAFTELLAAVEVRRQEAVPSAGAVAA